ncbi:MAG: ankyrin repeat domain-containing protein [Vicinamibacterales bacterium]
MQRVVRAASAAALVWMGVAFGSAAMVGAATAANAPNDDTRLAEAAERKDRAAVEQLLRQRAAVNGRQGDGATALHWAAHWDDLELAQRLINAGADVNATNEYGVTPLWLACTNRNAELAERLLAAGANANAVLGTGESVLMTAARTGNARLVRALLARGANTNATETTQQQNALMWAAAQGHAEVVQVLLENGADVGSRSATGFTPLLFAARGGDPATARALLDRGAGIDEAAPDGSTPLLVAVASAHEAVAMLLLERGANPNATSDIGYTPLHATVWKPSAKEGLFRSHGSPALVQAIISKGGNVNARIVKDPPAVAGSYFFQSGLVGATPYWLAAKAAEVDVMRTLAKNGADVRAANKDGVTPLMVASGLTQTQGPGSVPEGALVLAVRAALELGANVDATNAAGQTAAHGAAALGFNTIIEVLAARGANLNLKDKRGQTPLSAALARDAKQTVALLRSLGAEAPANGAPRPAPAATPQR